METKRKKNSNNGNSSIRRELPITKMVAILKDITPPH
jgi:hypothetical protein